MKIVTRYSRTNFKLSDFHQIHMEEYTVHTYINFFYFLSVHLFVPTKLRHAMLHGIDVMV